MLEVRQAVTQPDLLRHLHPVQEIPLEASRVERLACRSAVQIEVYQGGGRILHRGEALVEVPRSEKPAQHLLRQKLSAPVMPHPRSPPAPHRPPASPHTPLYT